MSVGANPLPPVDIELVLEGSYPYVTGGVSSWIHRLIQGLPHFTFGIIFFGARRKDYSKLRYTLPDNVRYLQCLYLHDATFVPQSEGTSLFSDRGVMREIYRMHGASNRPDQTEGISKVLQSLSAPNSLSHLRDMFHNEASFSLLIAKYQQRSSNASFLDYFWTWRFMHMPLVQILQMRRGPARMVHPICTGYAGYYGALRRMTEGLPLLLTEHGIYTRERNIEIAQANWIHEEKHPEHLVRTEPGTFKHLWINFFNSLGSWTYGLADRIVTLFDGNRQAQIGLGADPAKIEIIPNGIELERFWNVRPERPPDPDAFTVGFIGRIVPIKDIRTLLRAARIVVSEAPRARFLLIGPLDEDQDYAREMQGLCSQLGLSNNVSFLGRQNVADFYPRIDISVLTSVSEGQPLTILEGMAAGVPQVVTDIGGCRELVEGRAPEDRTLGSCGRVTNLHDAAGTADAILSMVRNGDRFLQMVRIGKVRVRTYYQEKKLFDRYRRLYEHLLEKRPLPTSPDFPSGSIPAGSGGASAPGSGAVLSRREG